MASCSGGQAHDETESGMDYSEFSDSDFLESETEGKKFSYFKNSLPDCKFDDFNPKIP